ncbi:MAG TPA: hypothetical protein VF602_10080, partial [Pedobacter sp.]
MKKHLLTLVAIAIAFSTYAQSSDTATDGTTLKAEAKSWSTELNVNPFKGELSLNNSLNQIKFRKFISENMALRIGVNANNVKKETENNYPYGTNPTTY